MTLCQREDVPLGLASISRLPIPLMILINSSTVEYLTCRTIFLMRVAVAIAALRDPTICRRRMEVTSASTNLEFGSVVIDYYELVCLRVYKGTDHDLSAKGSSVCIFAMINWTMKRIRWYVWSARKRCIFAKFNFSRVEEHDQFQQCGTSIHASFSLIPKNSIYIASIPSFLFSLTLSRTSFVWV